MKETRFKDTEIGKVPVDWEVVKLDSVLKSIRTGLNPRSFFTLNTKSAKNYYVTIREIKGGKLSFTDSTDRIDDNALYLCNHRSNLEKGDLLFSGTGTIGELYLLNETPYNWNIKEGVYSLKPKSNLVFPIYLYYCLQGNKIREIYLGFSTGSTIKSVPMIKLGELTFPLPSLPEQRRIAAALSGVDKLISCLDKKIEKKKLIKQGTMQQLLTGKKRLQGFDEPWVKVKLGEMGGWSKGKGISRQETQTGKIPCIRYGEIYTIYNEYFKDCVSFISEYVAKTSHELNPGQVLFTCSGETKVDIAKAVAYIGTSKAYVGGDIIVLTPEKLYDALFLGFLLNTPYVNKQKEAAAQGDAVVHISVSSLQNIDVCVPPTIAEQRAIASVLTSMDEDIAKLEARRDKYKQVKQGMMQQLLTGRIRLVETETTANEKTQAI